MGLAASQARMLLLTARKSDLEFRAQQITNSEMVLAMQTEEVARAYSLKISNQTLFYIDGAESKEREFSAANLADYSQENGAPLHVEVKGADGKWYPWTNQAEQKGHRNLTTGNVISEAAYAKLDADGKAEYDDATCNIPQSNNEYKGTEMLIGLNSGNIRIVNDATGEEEKIDGGTRFSVGYYSKDDNAAEAKYKTQTASIQIKEKRLQMDLQQVETQQKACDTEMDSVKKIMDKNIERTFKVFS